MRLKFLPVIVSLLVASITIVSCLGDNDPVEYSPDATIKAFELDTIYYGVNYKFTIDQIGGRIFNIDSVPHSADTIINKILVKTLDISYMAVTGDTVFNISDSVDFSKSMDEPLKFKVYAPDGVTTKDYTIQVRIHKQDPDSLVWDKYSTNIPNNAFNASKTVILDGKMLIYTSNTTLYSSPVGNGESWTMNSAIQGLPANIKLKSLLAHEGNLYIIDEDGGMYESGDGKEWQPSSVTGSVVALLSSFSEGLTAVIRVDNDSVFAVTDFKSNVWQVGNKIPKGFPLENVSSTSYISKTGQPRSVIVGKTEKDASQTIPWFTLDGLEWAAMATTSTYSIPAMVNPTVIYYNDKLYAFGDGFKTFYVSESGIDWYEVEKKVLFPDEFDGRTNYSMVVDDDNFIWIIWNNQQQGSTRHGNEVWKGRINRLGFLIQ